MPTPVGPRKRKVPIGLWGSLSPARALLTALETILIGNALKINPYNQPAVELIKEETKNLLI